MDLLLLHTNDMHNRRSVFPYLAEFPRTPNRLLLDAGDAIRGSNTVFHLHEPILDLMSQVGYDAMAFGNREFNYLRGVLSRRRRQLSFPFVCGNVVDLRGKVNHLWQPYLIKEVAGIRVGLIGLTPVQYGPDSRWQKLFGFGFQQPLEVVPRLVAEVAPQVDVVILLSHSGFKRDQELASQTQGIHLIIGGHSHTLLQAPHTVNGTAIVQTGCHGRYVGKMLLRVGKDGSVAVADYELVPMQGAEEKAA